MKKKNSVIIIVGIIALLAVSSIAYILLTKQSRQPFDAERPILFAMDFENPAAFFGWHVGGPGTDYLWLENVKNGKYYFEFASGFVESQDFDYKDVQISVDTEFLSKQKMDVSVACRVQAGATGRYTFVIGNDGRWKILKWFEGSETVLAEGWSNEINPDKNRLSGRCAGDNLTILVNGIELGSAQDTSMKSGSFNLGYNSDKPNSGTFDNLVIEDWSSQGN